jgi:hypothetical protein
MQIVLIFALVAAPTVAGKEHRPVKRGSDPNRVICRTEEVIGSRLASKKTCLTATQWEQLRRDQRDTVERIQAFRGTICPPNC